MDNAQMDALVGLLLDENLALSLNELCRTCRLDSAWVVEMVEQGVVEPAAGASPAEWRFDTVAFKRLQVAVRLQQDLDVNAAGAALVLDLLEELQTLRQKLRRLEAA
ncbi:MAG: MerR family transcriptional regulator [Methylococcaceae bacterium]|nr:MAG: MerR family transcriptional regulator [Methylococcaceae bacterium]